MQGGGYIPGFSKQVFGAGLQRDIRSTQEDIGKKARELGRYQQRRKGLGKIGGFLGKMAMKGLLGATMGPVGLMIAQAVGSGLGSAFGGSKLLSGKGPDVGRERDGKGLLGSQYDTLSQFKGGLDKQMQGLAMGAVGSSLMGSMMGAAGGELKSALGKKLIGQGIDIGGGGAKNLSGLSSDAKEMRTAAPGMIESMPFTNYGQPESQAYGNLFGLTQRSIDLPNWMVEGQTGGEASRLGAYQNMFFDSPIKSGLQESLRFKPEDWMGKEDVGGVQDNRPGSLMRAFKDADLNREDIAKKYKPRAQQRRAFEEEMRSKALGELGGFGHAEDARRMENVYQQSLGDMDRGNIKSIQDMMGDLKWSKAGEIGEDKRRIATRGARGEGPLELLRGLAGEDIGTHSGGPLALPKELRSSIPAGSYQGDILEKIPEQDMQKFLGGLGGGQENILSALEAKVGDRDRTRMSPLEHEWYDTLPQEEQWGDPRKSRLEHLMKTYGGMQEGGELQRKSLYGSGVDFDQSAMTFDDGLYNMRNVLSIPAEQVGEGSGLRYYGGEGRSSRMGISRSKARMDARQKMAFAPQDSIPFDMIEQYLEPEEERPKRRGLRELLGFQMGGMAGAVSNPIPYNLGGSVYQQPMQYQLGGLLKYRSPM